MTLKSAIALLFLAVLPAAAVRAENVIVRSAIFPGSGIHDPLVLYAGEASEGVEVPIWGGKFSPEFELPRLEIWRFGHWANETNEEGRSVRVFKERGRVKPPASRRAWLVFFENKADEDAKLQVKTFGVDNNALKEGGVAVMNLTNGPIGVELPGQQIKIGPSGEKLIEPGSTRGQVYPVKFYYSHDGKARPFVSTTWFHGERRKRLALVVQADLKSVPKLLTIDDVAKKEEAVR